MSEQIQVVVYYRTHRAGEISSERGEWRDLPKGVKAAERAWSLLEQIEDSLAAGRQPFERATHHN
jgi:hypothetical protein